jgi:hypothetical protein
VGRRTQGFIQVRAAKMCNTLHPASGDCIAWESDLTCFGEGPCHPYIRLGAGLLIAWDLPYSVIQDLPSFTSNIFPNQLVFNYGILSLRVSPHS